jgi:hypothetical protein
MLVYTILSKSWPEQASSFRTGSRKACLSVVGLFKPALVQLQSMDPLSLQGGPASVFFWIFLILPTDVNLLHLRSIRGARRRSRGAAGSY